MRTICTTTLLGRLVDLDMLDDQVAGVETLGIGVGFGVLEQRGEEFGGFLGPARAGDAELFACVSIISVWSPFKLSQTVAACFPSSGTQTALTPARPTF